MLLYLCIETTFFRKLPNIIKGVVWVAPPSRVLAEPGTSTMGLTFFIQTLTTILVFGMF